MSDATYGVAEIFAAPQGEGLFTGTLMVFIRLAGCTVGRPMTKTEREDFQLAQTAPLSIIQPYQEKCTLYDGRVMPCDTDFRVNARLPAKDIVEKIQADFPSVRRAVITGGEPLAQPIFRLLVELKAAGYKVHLETSGTIDTDKVDHSYGNGKTMTVAHSLAMCNHIAVSPKFGYRPEYDLHADEFKLLVDEDFDWEKVPDSIKTVSAQKKVPIFLQPVNGELRINTDNMQMCLALQREHPELRLSTQAHKIWGTR